VVRVHAALAERARPYLLTTDAHTSTDYINAVYIDVCTCTFSLLTIGRCIVAEN